MAFDVMGFSIVHAAETFENGAYVKALLETFPVLANEVPRWAMMLLARVLNSPPALSTLLGQLPLAREEVLSSVRSVAEELRAGAWPVAGKARSLLNQLH